jgi:hypothetical protein
LPPVFFHLLHRFNQNRQAGAIDVADVAHVDNKITWLGLQRSVNRGGDARRNMQIDFAFEWNDF